MCTPGIGPTQSPVPWVPGELSLAVSGQGTRLTIHLHLVPRLRIIGAGPPLPVDVFIACIETT